MAGKTKKSVAPKLKRETAVAAPSSNEIPAVAVATEPAQVADIAAKIEQAVAIETAPVEPQKGTVTMNDTVKETVSKIEETAKTNMAKGTALVRDVVEFQKGNLEAVVESGKIAAKGVKTMGENAVAYGKKNVEATTEQFKKVAAVKSPTDFFKLQSDFARAQFDAAVAETSKSTELFVKLAGDMFQPLQNRYALAAEKVKTRLAA